MKQAECQQNKSKDAVSQKLLNPTLKRKIWPVRFDLSKAIRN